MLLFGEQRNFALDTAHYVAACCSRRAGKSYGIAYKLLKKATEFPRSHCLYIVQSRETAKDIIWTPLLEMDHKLELGLRFRENDGNIILPNGSKILLKGASTKREAEKMRGDKYPIAVIDEAQAFGTSLMEYMIDEVLNPATIDYGDAGQICITGTPNAACAGFFYESTEGRKGGWSVHHWTLRDNPHLAVDQDQWLREERARRGWQEDHPKYLREYCGVWVRDAEGLVYRFSDGINTIDSFRPQAADDWEYVLGVDLGYNDPTAFVVLAYSESLGQAHVVTSWKESGLTPSRVAAEVEAMSRDFHFSRVVCDTGGFGKGYAEEMRQKHGIPIVPAQKRDKAAFVEMMNSDLASGILKIAADENEELIEEMRLLQWDIEKLDTTGKLLEDKRFHNHLCDAALYAWRDCFHHSEDWEETPPKRGTKEWAEAEERRADEATMKQYGSQNQSSWWEDGASAE